MRGIQGSLRVSARIQTSRSLKGAFLNVAIIGASSFATYTASANIAGVDLDFRDRVIYGDDERVDAALHSNPALRQLALSVAARISKDVLPIQDQLATLPTSTLFQSMGVCSTERFAQQKTAAECTGFLVAPDVLVTAGHCMDSQADCEGNVWAFDYVDGVNTLPASNVYSCKEIINQNLDGIDDFAVIRLDRVVSDRAPLKLRKEGEVNVGDKMVVIGHPSGLPLKIDDNGPVRDPQLAEHYFVAELDTYGGNSGSPVFNQTTLEVEGILVRGEQDYQYETSLGCSLSKVCAPGTCRGEDVQKIIHVKGIPST